MIKSNYVDYLLVYAFQIVPILGVKIEYSWIFRRTKELSETMVDELKKTLADMDGDVNSLKKNRTELLKKLLLIFLDAVLILLRVDQK